MVSDDGKFSNLGEVVDDDNNPSLDELIRARGVALSSAWLGGGLDIGGVGDPERAAGVHQDVLEGAIEVKGLGVLDEVHSIFPLANVAVRNVGGDVAGDADPSKILGEAGQGRFGARMCQGVVKNANDIQAVLPWRHGTPAFDGAFVYLYPLKLCRVGTVAGSLTLELRKF